LRYRAECPVQQYLGGARPAQYVQTGGGTGELSKENDKGKATGNRGAHVVNKTCTQQKLRRVVKGKRKMSGESKAKGRKSRQRGALSYSEGRGHDLVPAEPHARGRLILKGAYGAEGDIPRGEKWDEGNGKLPVKAQSHPELLEERNDARLEQTAGDEPRQGYEDRADEA